MIQVEKLVKQFGTVRALDDLSFHVEPGEVVGLLGPNGAGKTTTMRILTGAMPPTSGLVRVAGEDVAASPLAVKRRVGYLPEVPPLYPEMKVRAYLQFVAELKGVPRSRCDERIASALATCHLEERESQPIEQLSKGYRQRVGVAQAILHDPDLLILDEPTSGLDPRQIIEVRELIRDLAGNHTVILSSHILSEVANTCERVIVMDRGRVVATDAPAELTRRLAGGERLAVSVRGPSEDVTGAIAEVPGVEEVELAGDGPSDALRYRVTVAEGADPRSTIARVIVGCEWELLELQRVEMDLETIFLRLTERRASDAAEDGGDDDGDTDSKDGTAGSEEAA